MADQTPATLQELKKTFPNSTAEWRETQQEAGNDIGTAAIAYASHVEEQAAAKAEAVSKAHAEELEAARATPPASSQLGHQPLTHASLQAGDVLESGDPIADFESAVRQNMPAGHATFEQRKSAIAYVARSNPKLHQAYIVATNGDKGKKVQRLVEEKYENAAN